jgi:acyl-CoA synthetase (AMP-forming)/AMP-acid ligase II
MATMSWALERFRQFGARPVAVNASGTVTYADFVLKIDAWRDRLARWNIGPGDRVGLVADYHIDVVALVMALMEVGCIVIPLSQEDHHLFDERLSVACASKLIVVVERGTIDMDTATCSELPPCTGLHELLQPMVAAGRPGFVIFTSGSTGKSKAVLLDHERMTRKYQAKVRKSFRSLLFLKLDHIGGLNTLFAVLFNGGTIVTAASRQAKDICEAIERYSVELLPTTPSFLTMLLMSRAYESHDLSSLQVITYGTEVMPASTLASLHRIFPHVTLKQTYGLSELGILATQSKDSSSKWMKIGGEGFQVKVVDGVLWIKSEQAMLGYLNAPSPFDADGWYNTGDRVEVDGEYFQILGRESEVINVGGEKVFPGEIESFLLTLDNVKDVVVREKRSPVVGQMIWAEFVLHRDEPLAAFRKRVIEQCQQHLSPFKVPGLITIAGGEPLVGSRFKKIRLARAESSAAPAALDGGALALESDHG